jgi:hypothetical protein
MTTAAVTASPYSLLLALSESKQASGRLFLDDGKQLELQVASEVVYTVLPSQNQGTEHVMLSEVVLQTTPEANQGAVLGMIEVLEASSSGAPAPVSHCDGYILLEAEGEGQEARKVVAEEVIIAAFDTFSRVKFSFSGVRVVQNYEFLWECQ